MAGSVRGRLLPPDLDDRRWQDLVDEARALIPRYAPQWTDHNASDIGITLIELFAHMVEGLIYRLNRVPEKNYIAFLNLLGITRDPMTPARAFLTFRAQPGPPVLVPAGTQAQTRGSETEAPVVFESDEDVTVLPINMDVALVIGKLVLNKYTNASAAFTEPPAAGDTLTIQPGQSRQICLGFDKSTSQQLRLLVRLHRPVKVVDGIGPEASVSWVYSQAGVEPGAWVPFPGVDVDDGTAGLTRDGVVRLTPQLDWAAEAPPTWGTVSPSSVGDTVADPYFWVGIRIANTSAAAIEVGVTALLFNSVSAWNALTIALPETIGVSDGTAFQLFPLEHAPLFKRLETDTPYDHLQLDVGGTPYAMAEDFPAGAADVYRLDPVTAEVTFGSWDGSSGNGTIPPDGATISATTYRYVAGGVSGNVGAGTVTSMRTPVAGVNKVINLASAYGGSDEEPIEETKRRAPEVLRNRYRAVTAEDFEYLAREATTDVVIVKCLEPRIHAEDDPNGNWLAGDPWRFAGMVREPGNVYVVVVPDPGAAVARPEPTVELAHEVQRYLDGRRDVTARLAVIGPRYLPIKVSAELHVWQRAIDDGLVASAADVQQSVENKIEAFLHPVHGGSKGHGWKVGQHLYAPDLFKEVMPDEDLGFLARLDVEPLVPPYHDPPLGPGGPWTDAERPFSLPLALPSAWVRLADYELVCFGSRTVTTVVE